MSTVIDANMKLFAERMHISSSRMIQDYGLSTIDEIIEEEAERGNSYAVKNSREYYHSPEKLIKLFKLTDIENKFVLLNKMNDSTREKVLPMLDNDELVMGLYFFTQEKLLEMLMNVDIEEMVNVIQEAFPLESIIMMFTEDDLAGFFENDNLEKYDVINQLQSLPPEVMQNFIEGVTGMPAEETDASELINNIAQMPDDKYKRFMSSIDPDVQRQLTFQLTKTKPEYLTLFSNETYVNMMNTLMKPDMIKPMIMLNKESLVNMVSDLPSDLMSIVAAQVDTKDFAKYLQKGHMDLIEDALMI
jgi:hypothetical protein